VPRERRHHFVPEFHLGQFATGRRREVWVFVKRWGKYARRPVASSAVVRGYYALPGSTDDERLALEREFARLENLVAPVLRRLAATSPGPTGLSEVERSNFAAYAALLHVRGPAYRDDTLKRAQALSKDPEALGLTDPAEFLRAARRHGFRGTDEELEWRWLQMLSFGSRTLAGLIESSNLRVAVNGQSGQLMVRPTAGVRRTMNCRPLEGYAVRPALQRVRATPPTGSAL
jgi:hypothetical protein